VQLLPLVVAKLEEVQLASQGKALISTLWVSSARCAPWLDEGMGTEMMMMMMNVV
jgi:hypothetical protein